MPLATILIDDSPAIRKSLIPALGELADVQVIATAETADQGISALKEHADHWRLAIVDLLLKAGNGLQILRAGLGRRSDQHMVVLSNYATPEIRRKSTECGADAVFDKSTEIDQFLELCRQYSAEQPSQAATAPGAPKPRETGADEDMTERVVVDRLLTDALKEAVEKTSASVRGHLGRQGSGHPPSQAPAGKGPTSGPKGER